tara:strand:- start:270 stop:1325 length:1056 start_codon:yes stop_codon:yes gene_type:complete
MTTEITTIVANDRLVSRRRVERWTFLIFALSFALLIPWVIGLMLGGKFGLSFWSGGFGLALGVGLMFYLLPHLHLVVSGNKYLLATGWFGDVIPFGPGVFHPRFPWDKPRSDGNYSADTHSVEYTEQVSAKDATSLVVEGILGYQLDAPNIAIHDAVKADDIEKFLKAKAKAWLTGRIPTENAEDFRVNSSERAEEMLKELYQTLGDILKARFGVRIVSNVFSSVDYTAEVQESRDAVAEMKRLLESIADQFVGGEDEGGLTGFALLTKRLNTGGVNSDLFNRVLQVAITQTSDAKMDIRDWNFNVNGLDQLSPEVAAAIAAGINKVADGSVRPGGGSRPPRKSTKGGGKK